MTSLPGTIPQVLDRIADQFSEHAALVTPDRRLTFAELRDEVRRAAAAMVDMGVQAGDRVAMATNSNRMSAKSLAQASSPTRESCGLMPARCRSA